jgi:hypothetical protein
MHVRDDPLVVLLIQPRYDVLSLLSCHQIIAVYLFSINPIIAIIANDLAVYVWREMI